LAGRKKKGDFMWEKIFALYDLSESSKKALGWALRIGESYHSYLKILHSLHLAPTLLEADITRRSEEIVLKIRQEIDKDVRLLSAKVEGKLQGLDIEVLPGKAIPTLLRIIEREDPDLVVLGSHGRSGLSHLFLGSVAEKIVRHSPSPVLVSKGEPRWPPKKLILPVDISEDSEELLLMASQFCKTLPMEVELVHVLSFPDLVNLASDPFGFKVPVDPTSLEKLAMESLQKIMSAHPALKMNPRILTGPIASEICDLAKKISADLIFIPTHGRSLLGRLFMGSVAEHVVRYSPCAVMSYCPKHTKNQKKEALKNLKE
jgi:nucleotide-binding universal stress UspA family protein